jgi:hypothetical protein
MLGAPIPLNPQCPQRLSGGTMGTLIAEMPPAREFGLVR